MPGLVPRRRPSEELSESSDDVVHGRATSVSQVSSLTKRPRLRVGDMSESEDDSLPTNNHGKSRNKSLPEPNTGAPWVHQRGSIVRIKVKNFVTYTAAEFKCGPSLNMIIGPNGTGKSTLVCAICLGLGFPPSCLGRAKEVGEYVKHGHREAEIEIEIAVGPQHKGRNPTIRCQIKREGNKTVWHINGSGAARKEVRQLVDRFHIQVDNLCQFLPQDRVVEFAQLTPVELLESTQQAAAPDQMSEWHNDLKRLGKDRMKLVQDQAAAKEHLSQLQARQNHQRAEVERLTERNALLEKVKLLEKARPAIRYQAEKAKFDEMKKRRELAQKELSTLQKETEPALRSMHAKEGYCSQLSQVHQHRKKMVEKSEEHAKKLETKLEDHKAQIAGCDAELDAEKKNDQKKKQDKKRLEHNLSKLRDRLNDEPVEFNPTEYNVRIREKERELQQLDNRKDELAEQKDSLMETVRDRKDRLDDAKRSLDNLRTESGQRLSKLSQLSKDTATAWGWIQQHQDQFEGRVFGPPIIECSVKDRRYADAVESLLQRGDLIALTVTSSKDFINLQEQLYGKKHLKDIVIRSVNRRLADFQSPVPRETLADYGLDEWAIDLLEGPEPVLSMLCDNNRFSKIAVTLKQLSENNFQKLSSEASPITTWITGRQHYQITRRREYGPQASSTMVNSLKTARWWTDQPTDSGVERELKRTVAELTEEMTELANQRDELRAQIEKFTSQWRDIEAEKTQIVSEKNTRQEAVAAFRTLPVKISGEELKIKKINENLAESHQRRMDIVSKQERLSFERGQLAIDYAIAVNALLRHHHLLFEAELWMIEAESDLNTLRERNADIHRLLDERKAEIDRLKRDVEAQKALSSNLLKEVLRLKNDMSEQDQALVREWSQRETSLDDLNAEIEATNGRIELLQAGNPLVLQNYERRQQEIDKLETTVSNFDADLANLTESISQLRERWEPELDRLVSEISDAFSHNFEQIGCAGQVGIEKYDEDFAKWAIRIEVKFRENEQLSLLDSHRQSGGERAVSTIFYLMALQSLARAPFRVVDEINQGMDPRNERMVHERMVDIACSENTSQYFLITPKLLPGLKYHEKMVVHTIYSGETMPQDNSTLDFNRLADLALRVAGKVN